MIVGNLRSACGKCVWLTKRNSQEQLKQLLGCAHEHRGTEAQLPVGYAGADSRVAGNAPENCFTCLTCFLSPGEDSWKFSSICCNCLWQASVADLLLAFICLYAIFKLLQEIQLWPGASITHSVCVSLEKLSASMANIFFNYNFTDTDTVNWIKYP